MTDTCKHCTVRGNIITCRAIPCHTHDSWYAQQQDAEIENLKEEIKKTNMKRFVQLDEDRDEIEKLTRERDLAVAHYTQTRRHRPAYEQVCKANEAKRVEIERLEERVASAADGLLKRDAEIGRLNENLHLFVTEARTNHNNWAAAVRERDAEIEKLKKMNTTIVPTNSERVIKMRDSLINMTDRAIKAELEIKRLREAGTMKEKI